MLWHPQGGLIRGASAGASAHFFDVRHKLAPPHIVRINSVF